jgi:hypothetical protein
LRDTRSGRKKRGHIRGLGFCDSFQRCPTFNSSLSGFGYALLGGHPIMINNLLKLIFIFLINQSFSQPLCDFMYVDTLNVRVVQDSVFIDNYILCGYCNSSFEISVHKNLDTLSVFQIDTVLYKATCSCLFNMTTCIFGLDPGSYLLQVQRLKLWKYGYPFDTLLTIGRKQITIADRIHKRSGEFNFMNYQSDCLPSKVDLDRRNIPAELQLLQNFPNPFNLTTTFKYELPTNGTVIIQIFDVRGRLVQILFSGSQRAGAYTVSWDGRDLHDRAVTAGVYIFQIGFVDASGKKMIQSKKMSLVK